MNKGVSVAKTFISLLQNGLNWRQFISSMLWIEMRSGKNQSDTSCI